MSFKFEKSEFEKEPQLKKEVWLVDDNENLARALRWYWAELPIKFSYFKTAKDFFKEVEKRIKDLKKERKKIVDIVFMDGNLESDVGELRNGAKVIEKFREIEDIERPLIVAFSSDFASNEEMLQSGADLMLNKNDLKKATEFLKDPEKFLKKEEK